MAGKKKAAETEKKEVTVDAQKEQTQPAATQAPEASQEQKQDNEPAKEATKAPKNDASKANPEVCANEKRVLGAAIAYGKWKPVKEILTGYKWGCPEHSIVAGAINHLCIHDQQITVANVQLAIGRLYPQEKVRVIEYAKNPINVELFVPLAKKLVAKK